jgi:hypothetical protein
VQFVTSGVGKNLDCGVVDRWAGQEGADERVGSGALRLQAQAPSRRIHMRASPRCAWLAAGDAQAVERLCIRSKCVKKLSIFNCAINTGNHNPVIFL